MSRGIQDPPNYLTRVISPEERAERALLVGLTMKSGQNIVEMGEQIEAAIEGMRGTLLPPDVKLTRINDIPRQVSGLVTGFVINLWEAILIVLLVALLMMGWRAAVVMATAVPLCMISAFAVVRLFGVELEQFSIASLIIALGMLVDNAIVVSDNTYRLLCEGVPRLEAAWRGAQDLAIPILTSTLTTVAAFLPMLTIPGGLGDRDRRIEELDAKVTGLSRSMCDKEQELADLRMLVEILEGRSERIRSAPSREEKYEESEKASVGDLMEDQLKYLMEDQMVRELLKE